MPKKNYIGKVVSAKMQKSVVVTVDRPKRHALYPKAIKSTKRFKARDEIGVKVGDKVEIESCRPLSREICWKVTKKLEEKIGK